MPGIVEFPSIVEAAVKEFGSAFANEPERRHFAEYLTGLLVAQRKSVSGINAEFAQTTDQSCLNRWITEVGWDPSKLNRRRIEWHQNDPSTRFSAQGVIPIDNTLVDHEGKLIEDVGYFWDHADKRHLIAHDYLISNYVCTSRKHYALEFRRFRKEQDCKAKREELEKQAGGFDAASHEDKRLATFKSHTDLAIELIDDAIDHGIPGDFTFDCYFTSAEVLNHIDGRQRGYVGDLKFNRNVRFKGREMKASDVAATIPPEDRKVVQIGNRKQWYFTRTICIPSVNHFVRIVILWHHQEDSEACKMLVTNRTRWEVTRILRVYGRRWTGTETFHRDGKQYLGMGDCQLRKGEGQTRHMYLVMLAHSLLVSQLRQGRPREWAQAIVTTIGEACRAVLRETLCKTIDWAIERATLENWSHEQIKSRLALT